MANNTGTVVLAPLAPNDSGDTYPTHDDQYGLGGYRSVATTVARDAIPAERRRAGMAVMVTEDDIIYILADNLTSWTAYGGGGASKSQTEEMMAGYIGTPSAKDYKIVVKATHGGTITETTTISESGTGTVTFKINTTPLGGTANSVSSSEQSQAHASSNVFSAGDDIQVTPSSLSSLVGLSFTIKYSRTLA